MRHITANLYKLTILLLVSFEPAVGREPLGIVRSKDAPIRVEIMDTLPRSIRWNLRCRATHYIRNSSEKSVTLYFLSRRIEWKWHDPETGSLEGGSMEEAITPQPLDPSSKPRVYLNPGQSFVSSVEGSFGDRFEDGRVDQGHFQIPFGGGITSIRRAPHTLQLRFVYSFTDSSGSFESRRSVATQWKTLHVRTPKPAL